MTLVDPGRKRALLAELLRRKAQRAEPIPLSPAQRRMWLLAELAPGTATYNVPYAFALHGALDTVALARALDGVVRRHDVLRAVVALRDGEPAYVVDDGFTLALPIVDVDPRAVADVLAREAGRPFDLAAQVPIRALLLRRAADEHVLLVTLHHIATDGWSMAIWKRELSALYAADRAGHASPLDPPACTYADFARWQAAEFSDRAFADRLTFWRETLADAPPPLDFGAPAHREQLPDHAGALRSRLLGSGTRAALERVGQAHGTTLFATLLGAFALILHRFTGSRDFIVGTAFANRPRAEFEEAIGFFVNTVPLRIRLAGDPAIGAWLGVMRRLTVDAFDHQDVPFETLVELAQPARIAAQTPLVNVMFAVNNAPDEALALAGLAVAPVELERSTAKFDLTLEVTPAGDDVRVAIEYRRSLFDAVTIDALLDAFTTLAGELEGDPNRPAAALALEDRATLEHRLAAWNDTARPLTGERIERIFERHAAAHPDAVAVVDGAQHTTYAELNARANRLARFLRAAGAGDGTRIGILLERGSTAIAAMLAVLKSGAAYVPLDPDYPAARLAFMLADTQASFVLTEDRLAASLPPAAGPIVRLDADANQWRDLAHSDLPPYGAVGGSAVAYVMYTSGSTGAPKGVVVPHAGIERLVSGADYAPIAPSDTIAHAAPLAFDASTFEIWAALLNGARVAVVPQSGVLAPASLRAALLRDRVTVMFATTGLAREIARSHPATFASLHRLLVGGEVLDGATATRLMQAAPHTRLCNIYGPTEATTFSTWYPIVEPPGDGAIPLGRPIVNTRAYVLDAGHRPLPPGAAGELFIGGPGVAHGYLHDPERSAAKFIRDPFCADPHARLYATGDRVRRRANGDIEFLGRFDGQIKRRGYRIEPGEIEAALRAEPGVADAAAVIRGSAETLQIVAHVARRPGAAIDGVGLTAALRARLPAHLMPDAVEMLEALPLKANGKVDRAALAARPLAPRASGGEARPLDETEAALRALWEELLDVRPIGIDDNFFDVGGHSLLAMRMLGEIERRHTIRLPAALLFAEPTIAAFARAIHTEATAPDKPPAVAFNAGGGRRPFFFLHGSVTGGGFYCRALADRLGSERPFYALRPHDGATRADQALDAMAAAHIDAIKQIAPHGPYLLGGYCNGGLVALEMARQLRSAGDDVARVVLVDVPDASPRLQRAGAAIDRAGALLGLSAAARTRLAGNYARLPAHWRRLRNVAWNAGFLARRLKWLRRRFPLAGAAAPPARGASTGEGVLDPWVRLTEAYVPRAYDGRLTLLATPALAGGGGWHAVAPELEVHAIAGTHTSCITDSLATTADVLAAALAGEP